MTGPVGPSTPAPDTSESSGGVGLNPDLAPTDVDQQRSNDRLAASAGLDGDGIGDEIDLAAEDVFLDDEGDWAWVEEWRESGEPVPWGPGLTVAGFTLILVASAVYVLSSGLSDRPIVGIAVNLLVAAGLGPALWLSRGLPVLRWIAAGAVAGVLAAWLCVLVFLV